ncbi:hypothetical protein DXG01_005446 [Tephrocybe rancida]|nr:hypothetical protein DXG01_005446 [Tephrocybe rancida]
MSHPSRIPQHVPTGSQSRYTQAVDASHVYTNLLALGAPPISLDDFNRLYHGPFGELLLFMSTQIKGRKQVARDRYLIHQFRESHSQLPVRVPGEGTTVAPVQKCMAELSDAQRKADVLSVQLKASQADLEQTQSQATNLKQMLQDRRRATMLLGILQQRERVRISRFQEMIKMMEKLRDGIHDQGILVYLLR